MTVGTASTQEGARVRAGRALHLFFFDARIEEEMKRSICEVGVLVSTASFVLFVYATFIRGWFVGVP